MTTAVETEKAMAAAPATNVNTAIAHANPTTRNFEVEP